MKKEALSHPSSLPIFDTDEVDSLLTLDNEYFRIFDYKPNRNVFPEYFRIDYYAIEFILEGEMHCSINLHDIHAKAPCVITLLPDFVLHVDSVSEDCKALILAHNTQFSDDLQMNDYSYRGKQAAHAYPCNKLEKKQLQTTVQLIQTMKNLLQQNNPNIRNCILKLTNSLYLYLQGCFIEFYKQKASQSRSEQLTEDFFGLAESSCLLHKNINWYAEQLCVSPKYLANVIKGMTGKPAGAWINELVLLQAKTLLTTSRLTIQQIADRLGFKNQSHFGTFFRREVGTSPKAFRMRK